MLIEEQSDVFKFVIVARCVLQFRLYPLVLLANIIIIVIIIIRPNFEPRPLRPRSFYFRING